ncbi:MULTISPECIES: type 2 lanthipeptide synthetase LanM [Mammaliicoccus]|uniref:type 2 lanthipeptide synthetase LanM n=1 Tax=Mammaliicoccus TaxID=2803850 RepID=UPI001EFB7EC6|nr:type 2 lanthipeptide synthetase LanM [Mammaliicoccus sp. J-M41]
MEEILEYIYQKFYKKRFDSLVYNLKNVSKISVNDLFYSNIKVNLLELIKQNSLKHLLIDYQETYENTFKSKDSNALIKSYVRSYTHNLHNSSPLIQQLNKRVDFYLDYIYEISENFEQDRLHIPNVSKSSKLSDIHIDLGDSHNNGRTVAIVYLDSATKLLYKPKSLKPDLFYFNILRFYAESLEFDPYIPFILDKETYGWQEYIDYEYMKSDNEAKKYYYDLGVQTQILYALNANDMHYENIISKGNQPVFIDLETILQPNIKKLDISNASYPFLETILNTLLFDYSTYSDNIRFLGGTTNQSYTDNIISKIINEDNDAITIVEEISKNRKKSTNIPKTKEGVYCEIYDEINSFLNGFHDSYKITLNNKNYLINLIIKNEFSVRSVLRPTYIYAKYIEFFRQLESNKGILEILADSIEDYKDNQVIAKRELESLMNLDTPIFHADIYSKNLYSSKEEVIISEFFEESSIERVTRRINQYSIEELNTQLKIIKSSIDAYRENVDHSNKYSLHKLKKSSTLEKEFFTLKEELSAFNPLNLKYDTLGNVILAPITYDLYYGLSGGVLTLLEYNKHNPSFLTSNLIKKFHKGIFDLYKLDYENNYSAYHGRFSYFKYIYLVNKYFDENIEFSEELKLLLSNYQSYLSNETAAPLDYLGGVSGIISLLVDIYEYYKFEFLIKDIEKLSHILLERIDSTMDKIGLAHGLSGIALALIKSNKIMKNANILSEVNNMILKENELYYVDKEKVPIVWCNGVSGMVIARNRIREMSPYVNGLSLKELENQLIKNYRLSNNLQSVCHGSHGNSLVLMTLDSNYDNSKDLLSTLSFEWTSGYTYPNENVSLFLGKTGQMLNLINPNTDLIKNLLT